MTSVLRVRGLIPSRREFWASGSTHPRELFFDLMPFTSFPIDLTPLYIQNGPARDHVCGSCDKTFANRYVSGHAAQTARATSQPYNPLSMAVYPRDPQPSTLSLSGFNWLAMENTANTSQSQYQPQVLPQLGPVRQLSREPLLRLL